TGFLPAIPLVLLLPFVPESEAWREKRASGALKRPSFAELFAPALRRTTLVTALLSACAYAAAFGALQLTPLRIAPGLSDLAGQLGALTNQLAQFDAELGRLTESKPEAKKTLLEREKIMGQLAGNREKQEPFDTAIKARGNTVQLVQELGGLAGRIALAVLLLVSIRRGTLLRLFQAPGLIAIPLTYLYLF